MDSPLMVRFRLYVAGDAENSAAAMANLANLCREFLPHRHEIEIVDVFVHPGIALAERVFMTPTLIRIEPGPQRRIVGTLSQPRAVMQAMGLGSIAA
jgi:circadian clock protein KaiB